MLEEAGTSRSGMKRRIFMAEVIWISDLSIEHEFLMYAKDIHTSVDLYANSRKTNRYDAK